jgi:hypothetical protein
MLRAIVRRFDFIVSAITDAAHFVRPDGRTTFTQCNELPIAVDCKASLLPDCYRYASQLSTRGLRTSPTTTRDLELSP